MLLGFLCPGVLKPQNVVCVVWFMGGKETDRKREGRNEYFVLYVVSFENTSHTILWERIQSSIVTILG